MPLIFLQQQDINYNSKSYSLISITNNHLVFLGPLVVLWRGLSHHLKGVPAGYEQQYDSELEYCYQCGDVFVQSGRRVVSSFDLHFRITLMKLSNFNKESVV